MKICYILTEIANGGAERVVLNLSQYFLAQGDEVALVALKSVDKTNSMYREFEELGIPIYSLNLKYWNFFKFSKINSIINEFKPDVIHSHLFHGNILSRFIKRDKNHCRLVNTIHIMEYRKSAFWRFKVDEITFQLCEVHTSVAKSTAEFQAKKLNVAVDNFKVIPNGINIPPLLSEEKVADYRTKFQLDKFNKVLGCVGRLDYQKGFDRLLELVPEISKAIPMGQKWVLMLIGEGGEREKLEKLAAENEVHNLEIIFCGFSKEASSMIELFDTFIMPSRSEGYPLVLLEAMSHGVPMVLNGVSCIVEALGNYPNAEIINFFQDSNELIAQKVVTSAEKNKIEYNQIASVTAMAEMYKQEAYLSAK